MVADLQRSREFYERALGFVAVSESVSSYVLQLGGREIELVAPTQIGAPYPSISTANDPWFQHFAIAVSDMAAAYQRLTRYGHQSISEGGPQQLPQSTGSVIAYKFRDPDGHPLELSYVPGQTWPCGSDSDPCKSVDHTALTVQDLEASVAFYTEGLGFTLGGRFLNQGREQDRLDGLKGVQVDIAVLTTHEPGPHLELLHYRHPLSPALASVWASNDIAATCMVMRMSRGGRAGGSPTGGKAPSRAVGNEGFVRDPDNHLIGVYEA